MPKQRIENLMTELHELFGSVDPSPEQEKLLAELDSHVHDINTQQSVNPTPLETIELLLEQLGEAHPKTSALLQELLSTLKNIGV